MPKMIGVKIIRLDADFPSIEKLDELCERQAKEEARQKDLSKSVRDIAKIENIVREVIRGWRASR
jgi:ADP-ribose pyrophosphatase YjhB (NUDIX family)